MDKKIVIIDYGSGNLRSIDNAFKKIGADVIVSSDIDVIGSADALILPGVGAFGSAMGNIKEYKEAIYAHIEAGRPLLGICLGLQMLFEESEENLGIKGLGVFKGCVRRFNLPDKYKIPQMGWNQIQINDTDENNIELLKNSDDKYMYFVHSYYIDPEDKNIITAYTDYGMKVPVAVGVGNVQALQFHPEKSAEDGLEILRRWINTI